MHYQFRLPETTSQVATHDQLCLDDLIEEYIAEKIGFGNSTDNTVRKYRWALGKLAAVCTNPPATRAQVIRSVGVNLSPNSRKQVLTIQKPFLAWIEEIHGVRQAFDFANLPKIHMKRTQPRVLTDVQIKNILAVCQNPTLLAIIVVMLDTGIRINELFHLRKSSITEEGGRFFLSISIEGKTGERTVPVSDYSVRLMRAIGDDTYIWTKRSKPFGPMSMGLIQYHIRAMLKKAGVAGRFAGPHVFRHTFATRFLRQGGRESVLSKLLGHESMTMTMKYITLAAVDQSEQHRQYGMVQTMDIESIVKGPFPLQCNLQRSQRSANTLLGVLRDRGPV